MGRWYVAVLVLECRVGDHPTGTADVQIRLVAADSHEEAYEKALFLGRRAEQTYSNADGEQVTWLFKGLHALDEAFAQELTDGAEIWGFTTSRSANSLVAEKAKLAFFWFEANRDRKASELLGDQ